ncbi:PorT family protein [Psychroflexus sp. YR1-1]|uniref:PorT family protein n=1 Tax=Psychroflexus aurantiacus TaxID=2709310 RepID=A0A6B3R0K5_9FLAO|nr:outer membrane beta-barrel protein [Psychroflexus aurantiacus]NEV92930.1 PorT family protein [Psychroflexus aurantiacus]
MKSSKSIERLFQEGLKDLQASPSPKVWNGIEAKLTGKKQSRRTLPFWWQVASVAAVVLIFSSIGAFYYQSSVYKPSIRFKTPVNFTSSSLELIPARYRFSSVNERLSEIETAMESRLAFQFSESETNNSVLASLVLNPEPTDPKAGLAAKPKTSGSSLSTVSQLNGLSVNSLSKASMASTLISTDEEEYTTDRKPSLFDAIEANNRLAGEENKSMQRPWAIQPNVAPVFMNSFSGGNPIAPTLLGKTTSNPNLSYGVNVAYAINKKIKIRTGINQVAMGYNTQDVILSISSFKGERLINNNIQTHLAGDVSLISASPFGNMQSRTLSSSLVPSNLNPIGSIHHEMGFLEVPLEVEYALIDKKLGVHLLGGASTYVLNTNEIFFENNGSSSSIGEADNINDFSFSANLGVGLDFSFSERVSLNLEPKFMYQINTFDRATTNFEPYFFGIYSGVKFKF